MSYDFTLCKLDTGVDLETALARREQMVVDGKTSPPVAGQNDALVIALVMKNPRLKSFTDATHTELDSGEDGDGVQISVYADEVGVSIPYWYNGAAARTVMRDVWGYLRIIQERTGYAIYDPQKGSLVDLEADFETALAIYCGVVDRFGAQSGASNDR